MTRVLFVDREQGTLDALLRTFNGLRLGWDMACATSTERALVMLADQDFDVVAT